MFFIPEIMFAKNFNAKIVIDNNIFCKISISWLQIKHDPKNLM